MELSGKIFKVNPLQTGEGKNGPWKKQEVVIEINSGKYPKKVCVSMWGDLVTNNNFIVGNDISVEFDIESREYNERWYTDVKAWRINNVNNSTPSNNNDSSANNYQQSAPAPKVEDAPATQIDDDLPF
ncbi:MAG: DUF3127 domain-containing protein [Saprospirales bacterium]|nr:DUF3127 domain-containing protein [Saprospirales bacterium]